MCKERYNYNFFYISSPPTSPWCHFGEYYIHKQRMQLMYMDMLFAFRSKCKQRIRIHMLHRLFSSVDTLQNGARVPPGYFNDVFTTFLSLDCVRILAIYGRARKLSEFVKIYEFVFRRWTKVLQVWNNMRVSNNIIFIFGWTFPLNKLYFFISAKWKLSLWFQ